MRSGRGMLETDVVSQLYGFRYNDGQHLRIASDARIFLYFLNKNKGKITMGLTTKGSSLATKDAVIFSDSEILL